MKPKISESEWMGWIAKHCHRAMSPTTDEIHQRAQESAAPTTERVAARISSGWKLWRLSKNQNLALTERAAQMWKRHPADAKLKAEEWSGLFHEKLHSALSRVNIKPQQVYN